MNPPPREHPRHDEPTGGSAMANPLFTYTPVEAKYLQTWHEVRQSLLSPHAAKDEDAIYEDGPEGATDPVRPAFTRDVDRILNNAFYNRCMDKTQVFPLRRNDDLTRRSYHLQLVSQTARKIARALRLNEALTEAIALGHDMGHTPFGHSGEDILSDLYRGNTGRFFSHNVHSVRILRTVAGRELSLQTLNGILCHCGETAFREYRPEPCPDFKALDTLMAKCYADRSASKTLRPSTLEGCVVRICDILAYLGKDRQDALSIDVLDAGSYPVKDNVLGATNRDFIANATANIIRNSIGRDHLAMDQEVIDAILAIKERNYKEIYSVANRTLDARIRPMMTRLYERFLNDLRAGEDSSYIYRHHLKAWWMSAAYREQAEEKPDDTVADYIASMTDDYFIDLFNTLYPKEAVPAGDLYVGYFR